MIVEQGVIGNRKMLATIGKNGEIRYLFWPTIDYPQHIHASLPGVSFDNNFSWLTDFPWSKEQRYLENTNIVETKFRNDDIEIIVQDFIFPTKDILVRSFSLSSKRKISLKFFYYKDTHLIETPIGDTTYFDRGIDAIIAYKRNCYLAYGSDEKSYGHQCGVHGEGSDAFRDVSDGKLNNNYIALYLGTNGVNSALSWNLNIEPNDNKQLTIFFCFGRNKQEVLRLLNFARKNKNTMIKERIKVDKMMINRYMKYVRVNILIKRSLFLIKALHCSDHGGFIAAPCLEPDYRYCWPRDAAYMAYAIDLYGFHKETEAFYLWCKKAQEKDGSWYQRYYIEACCPGPAWGMQCDQAGIILWGISKHYELTKSLPKTKSFLEQMQTTVEKASKHLLKLIDEDSLVSSLDLWEERYGANAYTNAAICAGLREAAKILEVLGNSKLSKECSIASKKIRNAIVEYLWSEEKKRFLKSVKPLDETIDTSLLGLCFPFEIVNENDMKMRSTAEQIEKGFNYTIGGIGRYPNDTYYGGNPWIITTLWLAIYYAKLGDILKASQLIKFVADKTSELGLMPEQLEKNTGKFISAFPLGWSHAMFLIASKELKNGRIQKI